MLTMIVASQSEPGGWRSIAVPISPTEIGVIDMVDAATVGMAIIPAGIEMVLKVCLLRACRTATCSGPAAFVRNRANRDGRRPPRR